MKIFHANTPIEHSDQIWLIQKDFIFQFRGAVYADPYLEPCSWTIILITTSCLEQIDPHCAHVPLMAFRCLCNPGISRIAEPLSWLQRTVETSKAYSKAFRPGSLDCREKPDSANCRQICVCLQYRQKYSFFFCDYFREIRQSCACQNAAILIKAWCMYMEVMITKFDLAFI